jgi:hypothetical protein
MVSGRCGNGVAVLKTPRCRAAMLHQEKPHVLSDGILEVNYQKRK